jgi:diguanylate cyclase (GGDEF)-like protein
VASPILADGRVDGVVVAFRDISERKGFEEQLTRQALFDSLTDLPNRALFEDRVRQAIRGAERKRSPFAVLLMDLDRFKDINDTYGHYCGDLLLKEVAARLGRSLRDSDTLARLGDDEFAVLLLDTTVPGSLLVAEHLQAAVREPVTLTDVSLAVEGSVGVVAYPDHGADVETLLRRADIAMYGAKGRNEALAVYVPEGDRQCAARLRLLAELPRALEHDELCLHYQPKINLASGAVDGVEALVRWHHPELGLLPPGQFVPLAESTGLIKRLSHWVLDAALTQCRRWCDSGQAVRIAVNLSARNLHDALLADTLSALLTHHDVQPDLLILEITESAVMADQARAMETLSRIHAMGVRIAIDDFGTGYSSLAYLTRLPVDELKLDRSFVIDMADNESDVHVARSVIELGHSLGLRVVAEGVEDRESEQVLCSLGCDTAQGYYFGTPVPGDAYLGWLRSRGGMG